MKIFKLAFVIHISSFVSVNSQFQNNNQFQFNPYNIFGQFGFNQQTQRPTTQQQVHRPIYQQQAYRPINQPNVYYPQQQTQPAVDNRNQVIQTGSNSALRLSERKCSEYLKKAQNSVFFGSLALIIGSINNDNCDVSQSFMIGGENAKMGEFPHMAGKLLFRTC